MIAKDLRPFLFVYCGECCQSYEMVYYRYNQTFHCPECYEDVKYDDVDPDKIRFDTRKFVAFLKESIAPAMKERLLSLYMDMDKIDDVAADHESIQWIHNEHDAI